MTIKNLLENVDAWETAATDLVHHYMSKDKCFSSGEIARDLRTYRPDFRFSVPQVGGFLKKLFFSDGMGEYTTRLGQVKPIMISRETQGVGSTPKGVEVFVYGPDSQTCLHHKFEVDIPRPKAGKKRPSVTKPVSITTESSTFTAKVHKDRRICLKAKVIKAFNKLSDVTLDGGDDIYITFSPGEIVLTARPTKDCRNYTLSNRRRVLFPNPGNVFNPGDEYTVVVSKNVIHITL